MGKEVMVPARSPHPHLNLHSQKVLPEAMTWAQRFIWEMISESESEEVGRSKSQMIKLYKPRTPFPPGSLRSFDSAPEMSL